MSTWPLLLLAFAPALTYPGLTYSYFRLLRTKQDQVRGLAQSASLRPYFAWAYGGETVETVIRRHFDRLQYALPLLLCILTTLFFTFAFLAARTQPQAWPAQLAPLIGLSRLLPDSAFAGFLGAYLWGHFDTLKRLPVIDLTPMAFFQLWMRLLVGGTVAPILVTAVSDGLQVPVALALGAFPLGAVLEFLRKSAGKALDVASSSTPGEPPTLQNIQGLPPALIDRLEEEGITSTQHLALANPLRLFLRTNLELTVILDLIDEAILHIYVGDKMATLRALTKRSAIEVAEIRDYLDSDDAAERELGKELLRDLSQTLSLTPAATESLVSALYYDPQVSFIWEVWGQAFGENTTEARAA